jgi:hypothetical protein
MSHLFLSRNIEDGHAWTGANLYIYKLDKNNEKLAKPNRTQVLSKIEAISVDTIKVSECAQLQRSAARREQPSSRYSRYG